MQFHTSRAIAFFSFFLVPLLPATAKEVVAGAQKTAAAYELTLDDRIAAQTAIEQVYWSHRTWPADNPLPKPGLDAVLSADAIRAKVERSIAESNALDAFWARPITGEQLQAEMDRMAEETRQPAVLRELFHALGDDPRLIAECLARPVLADRLMQDWSKAADGILADAGSHLPRPALAPHSSAAPPHLSVEALLERLPPAAFVELSAPAHAYRPARISEIADVDGWSATAVIAPVGTGERSVWTGAEMIVWGGRPSDPNPSGARYDPATDHWRAMSSLGAGPVRQRFTAIWTGTRMIVWGGTTGTSGSRTNTGMRYDPVSDSWTPTSTTNAPAAAESHTAVWTGSKMIVWGGLSAAPASGGIYDPATNTWTATQLAGAPAERSEHSAIWTGNRMIVWGGSPFGGLNTGGSYDPVSNSWTPTSTVNAPSPRYRNACVWTGSEMIVWGGTHGNDLTDTGGRYSPTTDTWTPLQQTGAPAPSSAFGFWTGSRALLWTASGGFLYDPTGDTWTPTATLSGPFASGSVLGVWTGSEMILWTQWGVGSRYRTSTDSWVPIAGTPPGRAFHSALWTGTEMLVWGGDSDVQPAGARYDTTLDSWSRMSAVGAPAQAASQSAVWTGTEMIVAGSAATQGRYNPSADTWSAMSAAGTPSDRSGPTAVWTGTHVVLWGGGNPEPQDSSGGRYDPATDTWTATSLSGAPSPRLRHTAVWTGQHMIVFGGLAPTFAPLADGALYDPLADVWTPVSATSAPAARSDHLAVWTGSEMIVWGGNLALDDVPTSTGGLYDPSANTWVATATASAPPTARPAGVWTGQRLRVWGWDGEKEGTGGSYDPTANQWTGMFLFGQPERRVGHTAVWTGNRMIVYGGFFSALATPLLSGGVYGQGCETVVAYYRDVDGDGHGSPEIAGEQCAPFPPGYVPVGDDCDDTNATIYPGAPQLCDGINQDCDDPAWPAAPANESDADFDGYRICAGDCNDTIAAIHPGAVESCNQTDDNCNGTIDDGACGDGDQDGVPDEFDNCISVPNPSQTNSDSDALGDACDNCPTVANQNQADGDGDGRGSACDNCLTVANPTQTNSDSDTLGDACDNCPTVANPSQTNSDSDSLGDACDSCPLDPLNDQDNDGICVGNAFNPPQTGGNDNCPTVANPTQTNSDSDTLGDACDNCPTVPNQTQTDGDGDGRGNSCDNCVTVANPTQTNSDSDTFGDACDNCPTVANQTQTNSDADPLGDACDSCPLDSLNDQDNDGICVGNAFNPPKTGKNDNCPTVANPNQANSDSDSLGDACDSCPLDSLNDQDNDGICVGNAFNPPKTGGNDNCPTVANPSQTNSDTDTLGDACDNCPTVANQTQTDTDGDLRGNSCDNCPTVANPTQANSDGDTLGDTCDNCPTVANENQTNLDADSLGDVCDTCPLDFFNDQDNDGICVGNAFTPPKTGGNDNCATAANPSQTNSDSDTFGDACDNCPTVANQNQADSDGDARGNSCDNCPTVANPTQTNFDSDTFGDACDNCPTVASPSQTNSDSDTLGDACDSCPLDSLNDQDNDGICVGNAFNAPKIGGNDNCPTVVNPSQTNSDTDTLGDSCDNCPTVANQTQTNSDTDTLGDACDSCRLDPQNDQDNDGICVGNAFSSPKTGGNDNCPTVANTSQTNSDTDTLGDACDNCPTVANSSQADTDGDGRGNSCDNCLTVANPTQTNFDTDTLGDACDNCPTVANQSQTDSDGDGRGNACDNCPNTSEPDQTNLDGDALGDICDPCPLDPLNDLDNDGICAGNSYSAPKVGKNDNCPTVANASQTNQDGDSLGDACDSCRLDPQNDQDNDGICVGNAFSSPKTGGNDNCPTTANTSQTNSDTDTLGDACDNCPTVANQSQIDWDSDTVGDACDNCPNHPNSSQTNSDADARGNACDNCPTVDNPSQSDADHDSVGDACDSCPSDALNDPDGDGVCGLVDNCRSVSNPGQQDSDGDGEGDACDTCAGHAGASPLCDPGDGEVYEFRFNKSRIDWDPDPGQTTFNVYVGDLDTMILTGEYTQAPGSNPLASRQCGLSVTNAVDGSLPESGKVAFSLVTAVQGGTEGTLGNATSGVRPNANPCP